MSNLSDTLQSVLGDTYQIDRELGGGGMSRVFVATESALGPPAAPPIRPGLILRSSRP